MNICKRFSQNLQLVYDISAPSYKVSIFDEFYRYTFTFLQHSFTPACRVRLGRGNPCLAATS